MRAVESGGFAIAACRRAARGADCMCVTHGSRHWSRCSRVAGDSRCCCSLLLLLRPAVYHDLNDVPKPGAACTTADVVPRTALEQRSTEGQVAVPPVDAPPSAEMRRPRAAVQDLREQLLHLVAHSTWAHTLGPTSSETVVDRASLPLMADSCALDGGVG